jgi:phosphoribosyl-dephospho-CoA transferase
MPRWARETLLETPVVVVRRAPCDGLRIPVGVRGRNRSERYAAMVPHVSVSKRMTPECLVAEKRWRTSARAEIAAIQALEQIANQWMWVGVCWGPVGSVGFELATGSPVVTPASDLDLVIRAPQRLPGKTAEELLASTTGLTVRVDTQIETPFGCIALFEYVHQNSSRLLMRTNDGPRLVVDPWGTRQGELA